MARLGPPGQLFDLCLASIRTSVPPHAISAGRRRPEPEVASLATGSAEKGWDTELLQNCLVNGQLINQRQERGFARRRILRVR